VRGGDAGLCGVGEGLKREALAEGYPLTGQTFGVVGTITPRVASGSMRAGRRDAAKRSDSLVFACDGIFAEEYYMPNKELRKGRKPMRENRRSFINRVGKIAITTPPVLALLLKAEGRHYALALSGGPTGGVSFGQGGIVAGGGGSTVGINGSGVTASNGSSTVNAGLGGVTVKR
jgi:hypothetical protein